MKMVYIASPFRGDYETNLKNITRYCKIAAESGVLPVAPHIMYSGFCRDTVPEERRLGLKLGIELLGKSDELWVMGFSHSEGMKDEIKFAKEHDIPVYHVPEPDNAAYYPVSADPYPLLGEQNCMEPEMGLDLTDKLVVLQHHCLKPECRTAVNQIWMVTHGPGCRPNAFSDTVHIRHPLDGDRMAIARDALCGAVNQETIKQLMQQYPALAASFHQQSETEEVMER